MQKLKTLKILGLNSNRYCILPNAAFITTTSLFIITIKNYLLIPLVLDNINLNRHNKSVYSWALGSCFRNHNSLPGRTDNEIKNYWNTNLSKRIQDQEARSSPSPAGGEEPKSKKAKKNVMASPLSHNVVRTKAAKCTKVFINPQLPRKGLFLADDHDKPADDYDFHQQVVDHQSNGNYELSSSLSSLENSSSSDFLADFGMDSEFCLANLLGSEFA